MIESDPWPKVYRTLFGPETSSEIKAEAMIILQTPSRVLGMPYEVKGGKYPKDANFMTLIEQGMQYLHVHNFLPAAVYDLVADLRQWNMNFVQTIRKDTVALKPMMQGAINTMHNEVRSQLLDGNEYC